MLDLLFAIWLAGSSAMAVERTPQAGSPTQEVGRDANNPAAMWYRTPAGQYWEQLLRQPNLKIKDAIRMHRERYPNDGGPGEESEAPPAPSVPQMRGLLR